MPRGVPDSADRASATRASSPARFPCFARPVWNQTRAASSPGTHAEHLALPGTRKAVRRYIGVTRPGSPSSARIRHGRPYATRGATPAAAGRPAYGKANAAAGLAALVASGSGGTLAAATLRQCLKDPGTTVPRGIVEALTAAPTLAPAAQDALAALHGHQSALVRKTSHRSPGGS